jgi:hypothetical protein
MFVIQRVLEADGKLTLMDQNRISEPSPYFRLFATANTVGWVTPRVFITARNGSTKRRWTAGHLSRR